MPGSKRRALKNLLSPRSSQSHSSRPTDIPIASDPANYLPEDQNESAILEEMEQRTAAIGLGDPTPPPPAVVHPASAPAAVSLTAEQMVVGESDIANGGKKKSSKQRFAEREARKKEALLAAVPERDLAQDAKLEREKQEEEDVIFGACKELGLRIHEVPPDGHCLYYAIADQLLLLRLLTPSEAATPTATRSAAAHYLRSHMSDFIAFVPGIQGEDMEGATDDGALTEEGYGEYCRRVEESGDWGGEIEIMALSKHFGLPIHVIQRGPPAIIAHSPVDAESGAMTAKQSSMIGKAIRISYHRRMYGLGEHYNSLRPV